jgi:hypothetical protein
MYFAIFVIPQNADGKPVSHSPNYMGEGTWQPPWNERKVLFYNNKECYGIVQTESEKIIACAKRGECQLITEDESNKLMEPFIALEGQTEIIDELDKQNPDTIGEVSEFLHTKADPLEGIYFGEKLLHRWDAKPGVKADLPEGFDAGFGKVIEGPGAAVNTLLKPWMKPKTRKVKALGYCSDCKEILKSTVNIPIELNMGKGGKFKVESKCPLCGVKVLMTVIESEKPEVPEPLGESGTLDLEGR